MSSSGKSERGSSAPINIIQLKPGMENVTVRVRVLSTTEPRVVDTKKGTRTISNAVVGDSTGRVEVVMWGDKAGSLKEGDVVEIKGAWVSEFRGKVQLNIGKSTNVTQLSNDAVTDQIPETEPRGTGRPPSRPGRRPFTGRRRGGFSE